MQWIFISTGRPVVNTRVLPKKRIKSSGTIDAAWLPGILSSVILVANTLLRPHYGKGAFSQM